MTPVISLSKPSSLPSRKLSVGRIRSDPLFFEGELLAVGRGAEVDGDEVARVGGAFVRNELAVAGEHLLQLIVDVGVGELADRALDA